MLQPSAWKVRLFVGIVGVCGLLSGCGEPVREDRTVEFSRDGSQVAFQHGDQGVYVANADGKGLTKIFQPDDTVLATSRPLSSPIDGRLIFTTAHLPQGEKIQSGLNGGPEPLDGRLARQLPVKYACWVGIPETNDHPAEVLKLFEASCGHLGYVSAGLAVRWSPDGKKICYCASLANDPARHSVFEYDLVSQKSRQIFPHAGTAVIFDWTPAGSHLCCVVGDALTADEANQRVDSISGAWIGLPDDNRSWWRVPESDRLAEGQLPSVIEMLRASRPAWTRDDVRFAFVSQRRAPGKENVKHVLQRVDFLTRAMTTLAEGDQPITDLRWSSDGNRLGYVQQDETNGAILKVIDLQGPLQTVPTQLPVRQFAGFNSANTHLAYVLSNQRPMNPKFRHWALLLVPGPSRDTIWVAPADGSAAGKDIFSGMHVTFPQWSPTDDKLSLWLTFTPRYRSLISVVAQTGMWPGDPAVTIDTRSGAISWMAINPQEELQVGHYYLLKGDLNEAWRWYQQAREKLPPHKPPTDWPEFIRRMGAPENSQLFEYICLQRLGRDAEALAKWNEFEENFFPQPSKPGLPENQPLSNEFWSSFIDNNSKLAKPLLRDLFVAEVFLSVDGLQEALAHFRQAVGKDETDHMALSRAIVVAQLLLLADDRPAYVAHCDTVVAPLALKLWKPMHDQQTGLFQADAEMAVGFCLVPLFRQEFLAELPRDKVQQHSAAWKALDAPDAAGTSAVAINLILRAAALALNDADEAKKIEARIASEPSSQQLLQGRPIDEATGTWIDMINIATEGR